MDEPFVSKAVETYFFATYPYFKNAVRWAMQSSTASAQGCAFEYVRRAFQRDVHHATFIQVATSAPDFDVSGFFRQGGECWLEGTWGHAKDHLQAYVDTRVQGRAFNHQSAQNNAPFSFSSPSRRHPIWFSSSGQRLQMGAALRSGEAASKVAQFL